VLARLAKKRDRRRRSRRRNYLCGEGMYRRGRVDCPAGRDLGSAGEEKQERHTITKRRGVPDREDV